ncbi:MAG TPA: tol-pal system protein YbgF [Rhodospirillaceae bacterium]|nr:tol-pal system protein YbgF [Rhodospirillaceae bacterium]
MKKTNLRILPLFVSRRAQAAFVGLVLAVGTFTPGSAMAQDVTRELQNLKRDLATLQRYVYNGKTGPVPTLSEDTASSAGSALPSDAAAQIQIKLQEMERQLRASTGKLEEAQFQLRQLGQRLDTALADIDYRLTKLEGGDPNAPQQTGSLNGNSGASSNQPQQIIPVPGQSSTTVISSEGSQGPGANTGNTTASQPGTLGPLIVDGQGNVIGGQASATATQGSSPMSAPGSNTTTPSVPQAAPSSGPVAGSDLSTVSQTDTASLPTEPQALYDYSLGLMRQGDYAGAETALKVFLDQHSSSPLVSSAIYWLGETYYVRDNYREAAFSFVDVYSKHPKSNKAPDSLLKLGMSLFALGNKSEACTAFQTLKSDYPDARRAVLKLAEDRSAQYGC